MAEARFDLVVIGSGPGGYVAAIRASQLGLRTCVIEQSELGGVCLNWGCIPTKALLHLSSLVTQMQTAHLMGLQIPDGTFVDIPKAVKHSRTIANTLSQGVTSLLRKNKVTVKSGRARILGAERVEIESAQHGAQVLESSKIIIATGARPRVLEGFPVDNEQVWDYKGALRLAELPESLLVLGAGAIGVEFACFFSALGTDVTLVEQQDRVLPSEDEEVSEALTKIFRERGINVYTNSYSELVGQTKRQLTARISNKEGEQKKTFEKVLVCAGVVGNIEDIGIENTCIATANGFITADQYGQTAQAGVYAIGDVSGPPMLAHKASHEAIRCVEHIAGYMGDEVMGHDIPSCIYSDPQVASIGLTETQSLAEGREVLIGRFPFHANGKAVATTATQGFVKTIFDKQTGQLIGAHMIGPNVTELVHGLTIAQQLEATEETLMSHMFAHPTLSEALGESVMAAYKRALHI